MKDKKMFTQNKEFKATCIRALWREHSGLKSEVICKRIFRRKGKSVGRLKSLRGSTGSTVRAQSAVDHLQGVGARIRFLYDVMSTAASASDLRDESFIIFVYHPNFQHLHRGASKTQLRPSSCNDSFLRWLLY